MALPEDFLRTFPANATLLVLIHTRPGTVPLRSSRRHARQAFRRSVSQRGGASLRRLFVKCGLSRGRCEAFEYVGKYGLISAQPTVRVPGTQRPNKVASRRNHGGATWPPAFMRATRRLLTLPRKP